jgi:DNA-binding transcriptional MocR family regulator
MILDQSIQQGEQPFAMVIDLSRDSSEPLYLQIKEQIRNLIVAGDLAIGARLPPERKLAASLGVNRTTVSTAYQELAADGLVEGQVGRGTIVCSLPESAGLGPEESLAQALPWTEYFPIGGQVQDLLVRDLVALCAREDVISLAAGVPDPELYPVERFAQATDTVLRRHGRALLQHCPTEGHLPFREALAELAAKKGIAASADNILVVAGSQQGLDLIARALIAPGDFVVVEVPTYLGALSVFRRAGARLLGVPIDGEGMRLDLLERLLSRHRPQLIYTLPTFQNPSGVVMSEERRAALLSLAQRYQVPILEDDPYSELYFGELPPPPPVKSLDRHGHVIYLSTFSKILFPGIRIGWLAAPQPVVDRLVSTKQLADLHSNTLAQWALTEFIRNGSLHEHLMAVRQVYPGKCQAMQAALREHISQGLRWNEPGGGIYLWCQLEAGLRSKDLLAEAANRRVAFVVGEAFHADGSGQEALRLNFSYQTAHSIRAGVQRLGEALRALRKRQVAHRDARKRAVRPIV